MSEPSNSGANTGNSSKPPPPARQQGLAPSQTIRSCQQPSTAATANPPTVVANRSPMENGDGSGDATHTKTGGRNNRNPRRRKPKPPPNNGNDGNNNKQNTTQGGGGEKEEGVHGNAASEATTTTTTTSSTAPKKRRNNNRNRKCPNKEAAGPAVANTNAVVAEPNQDKDKPAAATANNNPGKIAAKPKQNRNRRANRNNNNNNNSNNNNKRFPWRRHIPDESVDPITLEPLVALPYPPFALYAETPYDPIAVWPFPETTDNEAASAATPTETEEERQQRILREQWGAHLLDSHQTKDEEPAPAAAAAIRHVHLYDGRALAYYMVSQLQFIDPLNRRDLTRPEIVNLDAYLKQHGFHNLKVVEAYDAKGVDLSRAGAAANTAAGRARILQQEAAILLDALFGRRPLPSAPNNNNSSTNNNRPFNTNASNSLAAGYQAHEYQQQQQQQQQRGRNTGAQQTTPQTEEDIGIYGDVDGILVIDDDLNPGLRGNTSSLRIDADEFVPGGGGSAPTFSLWSASQIASQFGHSARNRAVEFPALAAPAAPTATDTAAAASKKKPLPKSNTLAKIAVSVKKTDPEERQRMWEAHEAWRRRTLMANLTFGGANPVGLEDSLMPPPANTDLQHQEGHLERSQALAEALGLCNSNTKTLRHAESGGTLKAGWARPTTTFGTVAEYPDALILEARERLGLLIKLERRWKMFLEDDRAASCPLWPMDRPARIFAHHYSDFWRLQTESFDPEPKRYIHCVKLLDTRAPTPLLSEAAREWRGPSQKPPPQQQQAAGEATTQSGRFTDLSPPRERPKLELQKRSLPLELPPYEPRPLSSQDNEFNNQEERVLRQKRIEEKARREREQVEAQKRALEAAFASDDEEERGGDNYDNDDDSEWSEPEPVYRGDSENEE